MKCWAWPWSLGFVKKKWGDPIHQHVHFRIRIFRYLHHFADILRDFSDKFSILWTIPFRVIAKKLLASWRNAWKSLLFDKSECYPCKYFEDGVRNKNADPFSIFADHLFPSYSRKTLGKLMKWLKIFIIRQNWNSSLRIFFGPILFFADVPFWYNY